VGVGGGSEKPAIGELVGKHMLGNKYSREELDYLRMRAYQGATTAEIGIPKEEEGLSEVELNSIISELHRTSDRSYQQSLLSIVRYAGSTNPDRYKYALEPFLADPLRARDILVILCRDWGIAAQYKKELRDFIHGISWEGHIYDYAQEEALVIVAEEWRDLSDPVLLREVIALYKRTPSDRTRRNPHDAAYRSLWRLLGSPYVTEQRTIDLAKDLTSRLEASNGNPDALKKISEEFIADVSPKLSVEDHIIALHHENSHVKDHAAGSLGSIRDRRALGPLIEVMQDKREDVFARVIVLRAVADFGADGGEPLIEVLGDNSEDARLRHAAAVSLGKHGDKRALQALVVLSEDNDLMRGKDGYSLLGHAVNDAINELRERGVVGRSSK
jgi:hypothetical protein